MSGEDRFEEGGRPNTIFKPGPSLSGNAYTYLYSKAYFGNQMSGQKQDKGTVLREEVHREAQHNISHTAKQLSSQ